MWRNSGVSYEPAKGYDGQRQPPASRSDAAGDQARSVRLPRIPTMQKLPKRQHQSAAAYLYDRLYIATVRILDIVWAGGATFSGRRQCKDKIWRL